MIYLFNPLSMDLGLFPGGFLFFCYGKQYIMNIFICNFVLSYGALCGKFIEYAHHKFWQLATVSYQNQFTPVYGTIILNESSPLLLPSLTSDILSVNIF